MEMDRPFKNREDGCQEGRAWQKSALGIVGSGEFGADRPFEKLRGRKPREREGFEDVCCGIQDFRGAGTVCNGTFTKLLRTGNGAGSLAGSGYSS